MKNAINGATMMPYGLQEDIAAAAKAGFEGIEIWWDKVKKYLENHSYADIKALLRDDNILPAGLCPFLVSPFRNTDSLKEDFMRGLEAAGEIGCGLLTVCADFRPINLTKSEALKRHSELFAWHAEKATQYGIRLAIEPIGCHTLVGGPIEALELVRTAGSPANLGILMDTFHYMRSSIGPDVIREIPAEKLYIVHVNDSEYGMIEELADKHRLYPTEGFIDLKGDMLALKDIGYDGFLSVEVFRPEYWEDPIDVITRRAMDSLRKMHSL